MRRPHDSPQRRSEHCFSCCPRHFWSLPCAGKTRFVAAAPFSRRRPPHSRCVVAEEASGAPRSVGRFCVQWTALCFLSQSSSTCLRARTFSRIPPPNTSLTVLCSARWSWRPRRHCREVVLFTRGGSRAPLWVCGSLPILGSRPHPGISVLPSPSQPGPRMHPPRHRHRPWLLAWLVVFCLAVFRFCGWPLCGVPFSWVFAISFPCCLPSSLGVIFVSGRTLCAHGFAPRTQVSWIDGDRVRPSSCLNFFGCGLPFRPSSLSTFSSFEPTSLARRISTSRV